MTWRKFVAAAVAAALCIGVAPIGVFAADGTTSVPGIRASIQGAVAKNVADHKPTVAPPQREARRAAAAAAQGGGGGGSKVGAVIAIVGTIGGLAATYFVVKEMKKQSNTTTGR